MKFLLQKISLLAVALLIVACGGGSGGTSSIGGNTPVPNNITTSVNIGNITTIPLGMGSSGRSTVTVTNNLNDKIILTSATYSVTQNGVTSSAISATTVSSAVDVSQCGTVSPRSICNLGVTPPKNTNQAQYLVKMEYLDNTTGKSYSVTNIIGFSDLVPASDISVRYSTLNNNIYNAPGNNTTVTVPFQLTKSFSNLKVSSNNSNPMIAPSISCPGNNYTAGTLCNLYITVSGTNNNPIISGGVTVTGTEQKTTKSLRLVKNKALQRSLDGTVSYLFGVPITIYQNSVGNLISSAINVSVSPANGTAPQTVTLLNNGNAAINNIKIIGANPLSITVNSCSGQSLSAGGGYCSFNVNADSIISGQSTVTVSYNNGATSGNQTGLLVFNVVYIAGALSPGLSLTSGQGALNNVPVNTTQFYNIVVNNTGNAMLSNIRFTAPQSQNSFFSWASGSCNTNGTQALDVGESCSLVLQYSPTAAGSGVLNINAVGTWMDQSGNPQSYSAATLGVSYNSIIGDAFVYITPNYVSFAIRADNQDTVTQTFKVINAGLEATTLDSILVAPNVTGFSNLGTGSCILGQTLNVNESCSINTRYGPTATTMYNIESQINVAYKPNGTYSKDVWTFSSLYFNSSSAALVVISDITITGAIDGNGLLNSPYTYVNSPESRLVVSITYNNIGTAAADNFNVALNTLPVGYALLPGNTTCGTGITTNTLAAEASCVAAFYAVNVAGLYNPYNLSGTGLGFNIPGFSYTDVNTGLNGIQYPTWSGHYGDSNSIYITTSLFAAVSTSTPTWTTASSGGSNNFTFTLDSGKFGEQVVITIPDGQLNGFGFASGRSCTLFGPTGGCSIPITNVANFPTGTNYFSYYVTPYGVGASNAGNSIIQQASFNLN